MMAKGSALVLGGGGAVGNAWLVGVLAGLADKGVDATRADLIIGTSAGSTAAAQLSGEKTPRQLYDEIVAPATRHGDAASPGARPARPSAAPAIDHQARTGAIIAASSDVDDMRRRLGTAALELDADSDGSWSQRWRDIAIARIGSADWPNRGIIITAIDARTGDPIEFGPDSVADGIDLADAVAASTSSGLPYAVGERRYLDGGYRLNENADLAAGHASVLVLSPLGGRTRMPVDWGTRLDAQVERLRAAGSVVETILPDEASLDAFGTDLIDLTRRAPAARAGFDQGSARADVLGRVWP